MSIQALNWVFAMHPDRIDGVTRSVLVVLADHADERNTSWPSVEKIQRRTSWSERAVRNALRKLERMGMISSQRRTQDTSRYTLLLEKDFSQPPEGEGACGAPSAYKGGKGAQKASENTGKLASARKRAGEGACGAPSDMPAVQGGTACRLRGHVVPNEGAPHAPEPPVNHHRTTRGRGARASARPAPLPQNWHPSEQGEAYARRLGLDPQAVATRFRKTFRAKGTLCANWSARWELWCDEDAAGKGTASAPAAEAAPTAAEGLEGLDTRAAAYVRTWEAKRAAGESTAFSEKLMAEHCPEALSFVLRHSGAGQKPVSP